MKILPKAALFLPLLTAALLSGCGTTAVTAPQAAVAPGPLASLLRARAKPPKDMQMASFGLRAHRGLGQGPHRGLGQRAGARRQHPAGRHPQHLPREPHGLAEHPPDRGPAARSWPGCRRHRGGDRYRHRPRPPVFAGHLASPSTWYDFEDEDADPTEVPTEGNGAFGHGTAVAGTILQVAPNATILPIRRWTPTATATVATWPGP